MKEAEIARWGGGDSVFVRVGVVDQACSGEGTDGSQGEEKLTWRQRGCCLGLRRPKE